LHPILRKKEKYSHTKKRREKKKKVNILTFFFSPNIFLNKKKKNKQIHIWKNDRRDNKTTSPQFFRIKKIKIYIWKKIQGRKISPHLISEKQINMI